MTFSAKEVGSPDVTLTYLPCVTSDGVADRTLIESALARPQQAAAYENADLVRQAATLCFGLIKNHPWAGGNKRTATTITQEFLKLNHHRFRATSVDIVEMVLLVESDNWKVDDIDVWLRSRTHPFKR